MADGNLPFAPKCALAVDVSAPDMLGDNRALFEACEARAVLDHHESNPFFGQVNHVEPDRAAAGEMALLLIEALASRLRRIWLPCLFAAVSSDTGNFNYSNTTAETFETAAACVRAGADVDEITGCIYRTRTEARTRLLGLVLAELHREGKVAWACVTNAMFERAGALRCDTERIVNYLIEIEGVEIAALATEQEDGASAKFSLRSAAPYNVARDVAQPLGGGGHEARRRHHHPPPARRGRGRGALPRAGDRLMDGFLVLNKPLGKTSSDCVVFVRKRLPRGTAIGHGGTLDPMASGVLPVCVGAATRLFDYIIDKQKTYVAELQLGVVTDTQDATGAVVEKRPVNVTEADVRAALPRFIGDIWQTPPMYSAIKRGGKRLYELARRGESVEVAPRACRVDDVRLTASLGDGRYRLEVDCGKGVYIRTLCHDIGAYLGCGGHYGDARTHARRRVHAGKRPDAGGSGRSRRGGAQGAAFAHGHAIAHLPAVRAEARHRAAVRNGMPLRPEWLDAPAPQAEALRVYVGGEFAGIGAPREDGLRALPRHVAQIGALLLPMGTARLHDVRPAWPSPVYAPAPAGGGMVCKAPYPLPGAVKGQRAAASRCGKDDGGDFSWDSRVIFTCFVRSAISISMNMNAATFALLWRVSPR